MVGLKMWFEGENHFMQMLMCVAPCIFVYDYNYLHQQMHNYFFIKHTVSEQARTTHHRQRFTGQHFK
jgi:hypothetical protein